MSTQCLFWALKYRDGTMAERHLLIILGDMANQNNECWPSQKHLAERMGCSVRHVQRTLKVLEDTQRITVLRTRKQGRYLISHYRINSVGGLMEHDALVAGAQLDDKYDQAQPPQPPTESLETPGDIPVHHESPDDCESHGEDHQATVSRPTTRQGVASPHDSQSSGTSHKNLPSEPPISPPTPQRGELAPPADLDREFDEIWTYYPRKEGKVAARKAYGRARDKMDFAAMIIRDIQHRITTGHWDPVNAMQYIPHPATYFNQKRWTDEINPRDPTPPGGGVSMAEAARHSEEIIQQLKEAGEWNEQ